MLQAQLPGFATQERVLRLSDNDSVRADFTLQVGGTATEVEVVADRVPVDAPPLQEAPVAEPRLGGNVVPGRIVARVVPEYPVSLRTRGIEGTVVLDAMIGSNGVPYALYVIDAPHASLGQAALAAVEQWRYEPYRLNGEPIEIPTRISVAFTLRNPD